MQSSALSAHTKSIRFSIDKDHYRRIEVEPGVTICHLYPTLVEWVGREVPDDVNPRSHEEPSLAGAVPAAIQQTILDSPGDFYLANRGETILAQSISFDPEKQSIEIVLTDYAGDFARHGIADGGTTDAVIARVQKDAAESFGVQDFRSLTADQIPGHLRNSRVHLEVIVGLENRDRITELVQGRNTSRQVKTWTIADFKGDFKWIKEILDAEDSPFKGKIGYEENAPAPVNILEVIAILTLFHPMYNEKGKAPTVAYSSKGRMDKRLTDENAAAGYKVLAPLLEDILGLHDYIYCHFFKKMKEAQPSARPGGRGQRNNRLFPKTPKSLPLTGAHAEQVVPSGILYPLLASMRALIHFPPTGTSGIAAWNVDPWLFFENCGAELIEDLDSQLDVFQGNPQTMGKSKTAYTSLHNHAQVLVTKLANHLTTLPAPVSVTVTSSKIAAEHVFFSFDFRVKPSFVNYQWHPLTIPKAHHVTLERHDLAKGSVTVVSPHGTMDGKIVHGVAGYGPYYQIRTSDGDIGHDALAGFKVGDSMIVKVARNSDSVLVVMS